MDYRTKIAETKKAREALRVKAEAIVAQDNLTPEQSAEFDKLFAEIQALNDRISKLEQLADASTSTAEADAPVAVTTSTASIKAKVPNIEAREAFRRYVTTGQISAALTTTSAGAVVPTEFTKKLIEALTNENWLRPLADVRTINGNNDVPVVTVASGAAYRVEGDPLPTVDPSFTKAQLKPRMLTALAKYSIELEHLNGIEDWEGALAKSIAKSMANEEIKQFLTGTGTAGPQGVLTGSTEGTKADKGTLTADNLIDLVHALEAGYRKNAVMVCNSTTLATIRKLKDSTTGTYVWAPSIAPGNPQTVLGLPVYEDPNMPDIGTSTKSVLVFDPTFYVVGDRTNTVVEPLKEAFIADGMRAALVYAFNDARLSVSAAAKHLVHKAS